MDIEQHQKIISECHARHNEELSKLEKQIVLLRTAATEVHNLIRFQYTGTKEAMVALQEAAWNSDKALAATQDLSGLVLCDADQNYQMYEITLDGIKAFTVYKAMEP
jgi:hypothetical protein